MYQFLRMYSETNHPKNLKLSGLPRLKTVIRSEPLCWAAEHPPPFSSLSTGISETDWVWDSTLVKRTIVYKGRMLVMSSGSAHSTHNTLNRWAPRSSSCGGSGVRKDRPSRTLNKTQRHEVPCCGSRILYANLKRQGPTCRGRVASGGVREAETVTRPKDDGLWSDAWLIARWPRAAEVTLQAR